MFYSGGKAPWKNKHLTAFFAFIYLFICETALNNTVGHGLSLTESVWSVNRLFSDSTGVTSLWTGTLWSLISIQVVGFSSCAVQSNVANEGAEEIPYKLFANRLFGQNYIVTKMMPIPNLRSPSLSKMHITPHLLFNRTHVNSWLPLWIKVSAQWLRCPQVLGESNP